MTQQLTRRQALVAGAAGIAGTFGIAAAHAGASSSTVTLWRLNPDWGYDLTTASGSSTKTRCRSNACHNASQYRFFLTEADALAGRLHKCCLAQPEKVEMCIDLDALAPYYKARHGGVDTRCPDLPAELKASLMVGTCAAPTTTTSTTTTAAPTTTTTIDPTKVAGLENGRNRTTNASALAFTGGAAMPTTLVGAALITGGALLRLRHRRLAVNEGPDTIENSTSPEE